MTGPGNGWDRPKQARQFRVPPVRTIDRKGLGNLPVIASSWDGGAAGSNPPPQIGRPLLSLSYAEMHHRRCTRPFPREQGIPRMPARLVPVTEAFARFLPAPTPDDIEAHM